MSDYCDDADIKWYFYTEKGSYRLYSDGKDMNYEEALCLLEHIADVLGKTVL